MNTILAPTDFSPASLNATYYAAGLAESLQVSLLLFHVIPFPIAISELSLPADAIDDMMNRGYRDLQELKAHLKITTRDKVGIRIILKMGSVEKQMEELASQEQPLAIVMGIHSVKNLESAFMGSSVFHAMNHIPFPTFIIPENAEFHPIHKIGIACDLKKTNTSLPYESVKSWLSIFKAIPDIIHIGSGNEDFKAEQLNESISIQNQLSGFKPQFHFLTSDNLEEELNEFEKENNLDLLMLFPRKHRISELFKNKHAKKMAQQNLIPILSIHETPGNNRLV